MKVTIKVNKSNSNEGSVRGFAQVVFNDSFLVSNVGIVEKRDGTLFVSMPRYLSNAVNEYGEPVYKDVCNPIDAEFRAELYDGILNAYEGSVFGRELVVRDDGQALNYNVTVATCEREGSNIRGLGHIYFDDVFVVNNVSLIQGKENVFVAMPSFKTKRTDENGKPVYKDVCHPITKEFRAELYDKLETAYAEAKQRSATEARDRVLNGTPEQTVGVSMHEEMPFR